MTPTGPTLVNDGQPRLAEWTGDCDCQGFR